MGLDPKGQPPVPPREETPPPFEVDYDLITLFERPRRSARVRAFVNSVREHQERLGRS